MYKYDIPYPKKDQYALIFHNYPINISKNIDYLKRKMKAHRDEMGAEEEGTYSIVTSDLKEVESYTFKVGEWGNSKSPYCTDKPIKASKKPEINYKTVYYHWADAMITETMSGDENHIMTLEVICDPDGKIVTDLVLLAKLVSYRWNSNIYVTVTNKALVSMATYMPLDKESFIKLAGCGEKLYAKCGEQYIDIIKEYLDATKS